MKVLAFCDYYLPGFKGGGPIASVSRLVERLAGRVDFHLVTRDRDLGDTVPYAQVRVDQWNAVGQGQVFYKSPGRPSLGALMTWLDDVRPDAVYLNSYFSPFTRLVLHARALGMMPGIATIVGPRGEFSPAALAIKAARKRAYLAYAKATGLHRGVIWQVSTEHEKADAQRVLGERCEYFVLAADLSASHESVPIARPNKVAGHADFAFLSRICPIKNLDGALRMLADAGVNADFTIYGPAEDGPYWDECQALLAAARAVWRGPVAPHEVSETLGRHQFFLLPTKGENFGHVIAEALGVGCPVLISDRTPWRDLEAERAGFVTPLDEDWKPVLQRCVDMTADEYAIWSEGARQALAGRTDSARQEADSEAMFHYAVRLSQRRSAA